MRNRAVSCVFALHARVTRAGVLAYVRMCVRGCVSSGLLVSFGVRAGIE